MQYLLRRKIIILLLFISPVLAKAQLRDALNQTDYDDKLLHFGINVGYNQSFFRFTFNNYFLQQDSVMWVESLNNAGINLAWLVNYQLSDHFSLRAFPLDLTFAQRVFEYSLKYPNYPLGETPITQKQVQSITLSLPLTVKFTSDRIDNMKVYTIAGANFAYDLAATSSGDVNANAMILLKKFNYGVEGGLGFHIYFPYFVLSPEFKVDWGVANLHNAVNNNKYSNAIDKIYSRMYSFSITIE